MMKQTVRVFCRKRNPSHQGLARMIFFFKTKTLLEDTKVCTGQEFVIPVRLNMVRIKGVNIYVVSQIDARRLPEYQINQASKKSKALAACYIPMYEGAQIWFEYSIDLPHPSRAMYLFKLFASGHLITSWVGHFIFTSNRFSDPCRIAPRNTIITAKRFTVSIPSDLVIMAVVQCCKALSCFRIAGMSLCPKQVMVILNSAYTEFGSDVVFDNCLSIKQYRNN